MKTYESRMAVGALAVLATFSLTGCTYYRTTEQEAPPPAHNTVVVPQPTGPTARVVPRPTAPETDSVIVAPDSTVTVTPRPNE